MASSPRYFLDKDETACKRNNLMSVIESLHPASFLSSRASSSKTATGQTLGGSVSTNSSPLSSAKNLRSNAGTKVRDQSKVSEAGESRLSEEREDIMMNIFRFLSGSVTGDSAEESLKQVPIAPPENDETLLRMQHPPEGRKAGIRTLIQSYANGTADMKSILDNDINIIYECKRCRGLFRSLPNLVRHKKEYCKNTGSLSSFMNRPENSTKEEDAAFQKVLNVLHPPEPETYHFPDVPGGKKLSNVVGKTGVSLKPARVNLIQMTSSGTATSHTPTLSSSNVGQMALNTDTEVKVVASHQLQSMQAAKKRQSGEKESIQTPLLPIKRHTCPVCDKAMSERKNVRRHLVNVHKINRMEALKMVNSANFPKSKPKPKLSKTWMDLCVEHIQLWPDRIIHVLPSNFRIRSSECPVCRLTLCRIADVKRHLLGTHNVIIRNGEKYLKVREIASKNMASSPAGGLQFLLKNINVTESPSQVSSVFRQPEKGSSSVGIQKSIPIRPLATTVSHASGHLAINKVRFVESNSAVPSKLVTLPATATTNRPCVKSPPFKRNTSDDRKVELQPSKASTQSNAEMLENSDDVENANCFPTEEKGKGDSDPVYRCPPCRKVFSRRQTFKNHMSSFHNCTSEEFEERYNSKKTTDARNEEKKRSAYTGAEDQGSDEEPLQKLRKRRCISGPDVAKRAIAWRKPVTPSTDSDDSDSDSAPLQKLRKLVNFSASGDTKQQLSTSRSRSLSQDKLTRIASNYNGNVSKNSDTVPLATTTTILSSSIVNSDDSSAPQREKVTALTQNFVLRRLSLDNPGASRSSTVTMLRPIIKVQLKNSAVVAKASMTNQSPKNLATHAKHPRSGKGSVRFDFEKLTCFTCDKKFASSPDLKTHLLGVHSLPGVEAYAACYDSSPVPEEAQQAGLSHGFDILQAKCLICSRLYFSREVLFKHLTKTHHLADEVLVDLKNSFTPKKKNTQVTNSDVIVIEDYEQPKDATKADQSARSTSSDASKGSPSPVSKTTPSLPGRAMMRARNLAPFFFSKERVAESLKKFPKQFINASAMRCVKCKRRYHKAWDLKMHLLKHLEVGLFVCRYCRGPVNRRTAIVRSGDLIKHLSMEHNFRVTSRNRDGYFSDCRVNLNNLWEAYGLPVRKLK